MHKTLKFAPSIGWLPLAAWAMLALPALFVRPALDDWVTSSPLAPFTIDGLLPRFFWRPFEMITRYVVGLVPAAYPVWPHAVTAIGHGLAGWMVFKLVADRWSRRAAAIASAVFLISPATAAAVLSIDGQGEVWSTALGLLAIALCLRDTAENPWRPIWIIPALAAGLWKESGLVWLLLAPLVCWVLEHPRRESSSKRFVINLGAGGLSVLGYGFVRTALAAPFGTPAGRYQPVLDPWVWIERSVELVSFAVSTVDTLALFGPQRNIGIAVLTLAFGLPLLCLAAWALRGRQPLSLCLLGLACIVATTAPHWPQSHVSELYAYPTVATAVLLLACGLAAKPVGGWQWKAALLLYAATAVAVDLHKVGAMLKTGDAARHVGQQVHALIPEPPASLCVTSTPPCGSGYSVFFGEPGPASGWGRAAQAEWGWQRSVHVTSVVDASTCRANSVIVEMTCDGTVSFHSVQLDP